MQKREVTLIVDDDCANVDATLFPAAAAAESGHGARVLAQYFWDEQRYLFDPPTSGVPACVSYAVGHGPTEVRTLVYRLEWIPEFLLELQSIWEEQEEEAEEERDAVDDDDVKVNASLMRFDRTCEFDPGSPLHRMLMCAK
jgi:hypothetical protein